MLVLEGDDLERLSATMQTTNGSGVLHRGDEILYVDIVPWLPGEDHTPAIARDHKRLPWPPAASR